MPGKWPAHAPVSPKLLTHRTIIDTVRIASLPDTARKPAQRVVTAMPDRKVAPNLWKGVTSIAIGGAGELTVATVHPGRAWVWHVSVVVIALFPALSDFVLK